MLLRFFLLFVATLIVAEFSMRLLQVATEDHELWRRYEQALAKWEEARAQNPNLLPPSPPSVVPAVGREVIPLLSAGIASTLWGLWRTVVDVKHHRIGAWLLSLYFAGGAALGTLIGGVGIALALLNAVVMLLVVIGGLHIGSTFVERANFLRSGSGLKEQ